MKQTNSNTNGYQPEGRATMSPPPGPRSNAAILVSVADLQDLRAKFAALEAPNGLPISPASRAAIEWLDLQLAFALAHRTPNALRDMQTEQDARESADRDHVARSDGDNGQKPREHSHYFRDVSALDEIDIYRMLELFNVTDQALGHAIKKLILPGLRGAKDLSKDVKEARDTLTRWQEMRREDANAALLKNHGQS